MFALSPGVEIDRTLNWAASIVLDDTAEDLASAGQDPADNLPKVIAVIYRAEDNPPWRDGDSLPNADPYVWIVYDPTTTEYHCEATVLGYEELDTIAEPSFKATLYLAVDALYDALARHGE